MRPLGWLTSNVQVRICLQQLQRTIPRHSIWQGKTRKQQNICLNIWTGKVFQFHYRSNSKTIQLFPWSWEILHYQLDKDTFVKDCKNVGDTNSESYKKIYWFSWKCFQVWKNPFDNNLTESLALTGRWCWSRWSGFCWGVWHDDQCGDCCSEEVSAVAAQYFI